MEVEFKRTSAPEVCECNDIRHSKVECKRGLIKSKRCLRVSKQRCIGGQKRNA